MVIVRPLRYKYLTVYVGPTIPGEVYALNFFPDLPQDFSWDIRAVSERLLWLKRQDDVAYLIERKKNKTIHSPPEIK
tara:strand:+ start:544 stop:774 length:231 start_codon:yes stop_codon:yes gene_type:complete